MLKFQGTNVCGRKNAVVFKVGSPIPSLVKGLSQTKYASPIFYGIWGIVYLTPSDCLAFLHCNHLQPGVACLYPLKTDKVKQIKLRFSDVFRGYIDKQLLTEHFSHVFLILNLEVNYFPKNKSSVFWFLCCIQGGRFYWVNFVTVCRISYA